ncbi:serine/threonine protein kinase [Frankia sp. CNm7]|uniref:non-specific serine/threonine protein kinase n=1 Tax=Frankia nepalensis TaxID=1836974 RepID=A0A937UTM3_9ACTN|nr:serine/threonine-protein kinase [Frankia nepalensis]MBL7501194.1 serine/threonine protein kinase [Frankia nepalensis]MBL7514201.1 serine/threonine protein kinase [Frankia nepalensis]MBL7523074.1 serine/threonine protein kinase [Frankia nepalensis]MBL7631410.1 serine/threonine protein kinase [Frankia nepalensis]
MTTPHWPPADPPSTPRPGPTRATPPSTPPPRYSRRSGPPEPPSPALSALLPQHELGDQLGRGAFGIVYAARNRGLDRAEAVKSLSSRWLSDQQILARFVDEGRTLARLEHPHIVRVHQAARSPAACALVMEWLGGGTLGGRFRGGLTRRESCAVVLGVLGALELAHRAGVLHRDIKPDNIMFAGDGTPKVVDFGIAKILGGTETLTTRDGRGVAGTPHFMAPEQARGEQPLGPACDVYAVGVVLYELLSGDLPHDVSGNLVDLLDRRAFEPASPVPPSVPAPIASVVSRALAFEPADRYPTAEAFAVDLARAGTEVLGPHWPRESGVALHLSPAVGQALSQAAAERARTGGPETVLISMSRVLPRLPDQARMGSFIATPDPGAARPGATGGDVDEAVPVRRVVRGRPARRWPPLVAAGCLTVAALLALLVPGARPPLLDGPTPRPLVAGATAPETARVDLSGPVPVSGVGPASSTGPVQVRLAISAGGIGLGEGTSEPFSVTPGQQWSTTVSLRSWTRWVAGGAVRGQVQLVDAGAPGRVLADSEVTITPVQAPYTTAMGWGSLLLALLAVASLAEVLRALWRRRRPTWLGATRMVVPSALLGAAGWLALAVYTAEEPRPAVGIACAVLTSAAGVALGLVSRPRRRRPPPR